MGMPRIIKTKVWLPEWGGNGNQNIIPAHVPRCVLLNSSDLDCRTDVLV